MVDRYGDFRAEHDAAHMALADDGMWVWYEDYAALLERHRRMVAKANVMAAAANCISGEHVIGWDNLTDAVIEYEAALAEEVDDGL